MEIRAFWLLGGLLLSAGILFEVCQAKRQAMGKEPPCWKAQKAIKARFRGRFPADFSGPSCDENGYYKPMQCKIFMGCRCVDKYGNPTTTFYRNTFPLRCSTTGRSTARPLNLTANLSTTSRATHPTTQTKTATTAEPPCWKAQKEIKARFGGRFPADFSGPSCDENGYYKPVQCKIFIGCQCVDKYGNPTTKFYRRKFGLPHLRCPTTGYSTVTQVHPTTNLSPTSRTTHPTTQTKTTATAEPPCWKAQKEIKARFGGRFPADFSGPSCDEIGYYKPVQCKIFIGCRCVDKYGNPTTKFYRLKFGLPPLRCPTTEPPCWKAQKEIKARFGGRFPADFSGPSCDENGYYKPVQCKIFMGCQCVDKYGNPTTKFYRNTFSLRCPTTEPPCWKAQKAIKARFRGRFPADFSGPTCDENGYYKPVQCKIFMGCQCVDKYGNATTKFHRRKFRLPPLRCPTTGHSTVTALNLTPSPSAPSGTTRHPANRRKTTTTAEPPCWKKLKQLGPFVLKVHKDRTAPRCDMHGYFRPVQCIFRACRCVDKYGKPTTKYYRWRSALPRPCPK